MVIDEKDTYSICLMCYPQYIIVYQKSIMAFRYASVPPFQMIVPVLFSSASISARRLVVVTPFLPYFCLDFYLAQPWLYSDLTSRISRIMFVFPCCSSRLGCRFVVVALSPLLLFLFSVLQLFRFLFSWLAAASLFLCTDFFIPCSLRVWLLLMMMMITMTMRYSSDGWNILYIL